ncbi:MAG: hypothetical protein Q8P84_03290 [Deltaproteobacteria bacterium]|nr:hypothetical protein [Deltaproteobacteria bacterium]
MGIALFSEYQWLFSSTAMLSPCFVPEGTHTVGDDPGAWHRLQQDSYFLWEQPAAGCRHFLGEGRFREEAIALEGCVSQSSAGVAKKRIEIFRLLYFCWLDCEAWEQFPQGERIILQGDLGFGPQKVFICRKMRQILTSEEVNCLLDPSRYPVVPEIQEMSGGSWELNWRNAWLGLILYFGTVANHPEIHREKARRNFEDLLEMMFEINGWPRTIPKNAWDEVLVAVRNFVVLRFGGKRVPRGGIEGLNSNGDDSLLNRWIQAGGDPPIDIDSEREQKTFFRHLGILLRAFCRDRRQADDWMARVVFEWEGWPLESKTPGEKLLSAARKAVAVMYEGILPVTEWGERGGDLLSWIAGDVRHPPSADLVRRFLLASGCFEPSQVDCLIEEADISF